ncbi:S8 family serine peptidase [Kribbella sp. NPDC051770]|uniref:S8 family serine peptidase n=1 Tax=Kribbella sp. NPDC051770 TaxID=3155413 RepID=UPI00341E316B
MSAPPAAAAPPAHQSAAAPDTSVPKRYIVTLRDPAAASYVGGVAGKARTAPRQGEGLKANSAPVKAYRDYLRARQQTAAASVGSSVISSYSAALNGFTSKLSAVQAEQLRTDPSVKSVVEDVLRKPLAAPSTDYLGLSGDAGVWATNGGVGKAGQGVVVGVVDTGIAPENPAFAGAPLGTTAGAEPYLDGSTITYRKADGGTFTGACTTGVQFTAANCTTKLISARYFVANFGAGNIGTPETGEYLSPRDGNEHGSHTSSTAAGAHDVEADLGGVPMGRISGVSPAAKVAAYKACWSGPIAGPDDDGCATGDLLAAIDAAVADNVDVINYSIGMASGAESTDSVVDEAFRNAAASGIFVAAAGGNAGPGSSTIDNASPWITTAAASTIPTWTATVRLGNGTDLLGASVSLPSAPVSGSLVAASASGTATASQPSMCGAGTLDPAKVAGKLVLCERGIVDRLAKSAEVKRAGGLGMVLVNPTPDSVDLDAHTLPTVQVDADAYDVLTAFAAGADATATLVNGNPMHLPEPAAPQIAGFSSRGPVTADGGDLIKPDLAAPGVGILAAAANASGERPEYAFLSGTSMASPHIAGLAALYLGLHPAATPAEIKSALMTTTRPTAGAAAGDVFAEGNGQVDPTRYLKPGLLYLNGPDDWAAYIAAIHGDASAPDPSDLNLASIGVGALAGRQTVTRTVTSTAPGTFVADPVSIPGVTTVVEPSTLSFTAAGQSKSFQVTFTRTTAPLDEYATGLLTWRSGDQTVRSAVAVRPVALVTPAEVTGTGSTGSTTLTVAGGDVQEVPLAVTGLSRGQSVAGSGTVGSAPQSQVVEVPAGTTHARFVLSTQTPGADLDLSVYRFNEYGDKQLVARAATPSAGEQLDLDDPRDGLYVVEVSFYAGSGPLGFSLTGFALNESAGSFKADPSTVSLEIGSRTPVALSWKGLEPGGQYLGRVSFGDSGRTSYVVVTSDPRTGPPGGGSGAQATVKPEYALAGRPVAVVASGLAPGSSYQILVKGKVLGSGRTSEDGRVGQLVTLPTGLAAGQVTVEVRAGGKTVRDTLTVTPVVLRGLAGDDRQAFDGNPFVALVGALSGKGSVRVTIKGRTSVYLDQTMPVDSGTFPAIDWSSARVETRAEKLTATLTVQLDHGRAGQSKTVSWTPVAGAASSASIAKSEGKAKVSFVNHGERTVFPTLRYKLTSGDVIFATLQADPEQALARSYDVTGVDRLDLVLDGAAVATYRNLDKSRLTGRPAMAEPFWATFRRGSGQQLQLTLTNRPAGYSGLFSLLVGQGTDTYTGPKELYAEDIPVVYSPEEKAPVSRTLNVPAGQPLWATAFYEVVRPDIQYLAVRSLLATPLTSADLGPVRGGSTFSVDAAPSPAPTGSTVSVTAAGLAPNEPWTVWMGILPVAHGRASSAGRMQAFVQVPLLHGSTLAIHVTGQSLTRSGETTIHTPR